MVKTYGLAIVQAFTLKPLRLAPMTLDNARLAQNKLAVMGKACVVVNLETLNGA